MKKGKIIAVIFFLLIGAFVVQADLWRIISGNLETGELINVFIGKGYSSGGITLFGTGTNKGDLHMAGDILIDGNVLSVSDLNISGDSFPAKDNTFVIGNQTYRLASGSFVQLFVNDWSNVSITSSQVSGLPNGMDYTNLVLNNDSSTLASTWDVTNYTAGEGITVSAHVITNSKPMVYTNLALTNQSNTFSVGENYFTGGNVGIGTTSPSALLDVAGNQASGSAIAVNLSGVLYVNESRVGIGTDDPLANLQVNRDGGGATIRLKSSGVSTGASHLSIQRYNGTLASPTAIQSGDELTYVPSISGYDGSALKTVGYNIWLAAEEFNSSQLGTRVIFAAVPGGQSKTAVENFIEYTTTGNLSLVQTSGNVGIGTTAPGSRLEVENTASADDVLLLEDSSGLCEAQPTTTGLTWACSSDARLKTDIKPAKEVLPFFNNFKIRDYIVKKTGEHATGVIAQEVQESYPEMVTMGDDGYLMVSEPNPWMYVKAIQELTERIEQLEEGICPR